MPVSIMVPLKVNRPTIAAQNLASVNVRVQPENASYPQEANTRWTPLPSRLDSNTI